MPAYLSVPQHYRSTRRREFNEFLGVWLRNLGEQGHRLAEPEA